MSRRRWLPVWAKGKGKSSAWPSWQDVAQQAAQSANAGSGSGWQPDQQQAAVPAWLGTRYACDEVLPDWAATAVAEVSGQNAKSGTDPVDSPSVRAWLLGLAPQALAVEICLHSLRCHAKLCQMEKQIHFCSVRYETTGSVWHEIGARQYWRCKSGFDQACQAGNLTAMAAAKAEWQKHRSDSICLAWQHTCICACLQAVWLKLFYNF